MSTNAKMLSAKELLRYRTGLEQSMPPKGGIKDFMPDGSWLQDKCIENFHQERERAISEPRVLRSKDMVRGEWKPDVGLIELFHEMKNFWEHMGFNDKKRKWLHPEEALFLLETSILEIWYDGLPMSLQEAYSTLTGHIIQLEFYQVYAYLRRVGYVVLRHQGRYLYTKYERQIGLNKFHRKKKSKGSTKDPPGLNEKEQFSIDTEHNMDVTENVNRGNVTNIKDETVPDASSIVSTDKENVAEQCKTGAESSELDKVKDEVEVDVNCSMEVDSGIKHAVTSVNDELSERINEPNVTNTDSQTKHSSWNFDEIVFPNFFSGDQVVNIHKPNTDYIPQGSDLDFNNESYDYVKDKFINTKKEKRKNQLKDKESEKTLEFSHHDIMTRWQKVKKSCKNWTEYKQARTREKQSWNRATAFPHLYNDKIVPLVRPESASSTYSVLNQLHIIEDYTTKKQTNEKKPEILPDFDVYAPNTKFKKSSPGIPDFRVKVSRSDEPMPDLRTVSLIDTYLSDEVPLHWSVVDCGNISFYNLANFSLPVDIALG